MRLSASYHSVISQVIGVLDFKRRLFIFNDFSDMLTDRLVTS